MKTSTRLEVLLCLCLPMFSAGAHAEQSCSKDAGVVLQVLGSGGPIADDGRASSSYLVWVDGVARALVDVGAGSFLRFGEAGARFELPLFVFFLSLTGIVTARRLLSGTPYAVLIIFVTAAILTPPDVVSQVFLALPMIALYLLGVGVAWVFEPRRKKAKAESGDVAS